MKKIILFFIIISLNSYILLSQLRSDVKTPKGSNVVAYMPDEMSSFHRAYWDNYHDSVYPNAEQINTYGSYSSSSKFNCHGYAWYMVESGFGLNNPRWIGYYYPTREDIYMSDGSYVQVANEMYPGKISWGSGDHSAITTSQSGVFKSKWYEYPLFIHNWDDTPYGTNNLKYYVSTNINGSSLVLCNNSTRDFSATYIPNASYDWSVGNGLTLSNDGEYNTTVTANSNFIGNSWISVEITSPLGGDNSDVKTSKEKIFWVGKPNPNNISFVRYTYYDEYTLSPFGENILVTNDASMMGADEAMWDMDFSYSNIVPPGWMINVFGVWDINGTGLTDISIKAHNTCGWSDYSNPTTFTIESGGWYMSMAPNPSSDYVEISITDKLGEKTQSLPEEYQITIYNRLQVPVYSSGKTKEPVKIISTAKLQNGVYFVHFTIGKEIKVKQLIIQH